MLSFILGSFFWIFHDGSKWEPRNLRHAGTFWLLNALGTWELGRDPVCVGTKNILCYWRALFPGYSRIEARVWLSRWESVALKKYLLLMASVLQGACSIAAELFCLQVSSAVPLTASNNPPKSNRPPATQPHCSLWSRWVLATPWADQSWQHGADGTGLVSPALDTSGSR